MFFFSHLQNRYNRYKTFQLLKYTSSTCSQFYCPCHHPNSKISLYHSYSEISSYAHNKSDNSIQGSMSNSQNFSKNWSSCLSPLFSHSHLIVLLVPHLLSHSIVLLSLLVSKFLIDYSFTLHWSCGIVYQHTFVILLITPMFPYYTSESCFSI